MGDEAGSRLGLDSLRHGRGLAVLSWSQALARRFPVGVLGPAAELVGSGVGPILMSDKKAMLERHLRRVARWRGTSDDNSDPGIEAVARRGFGTYSRYWAESFFLPTASAVEIDRGFSFIGFDKLVDIRNSGRAPLMVIPHLGGWEWAAAWLGRVAGVPVTAVVERLEPDEVFDWFVELRSAFGVNVIPLGTGAGLALLRSAKRGDVICLLADRDIASTGVEVEFFGESTMLPAGPAMLSSKTGNPLVPTAVYFDGRKRICVVGDPIEPDGRSGEELLEVMARQLELMIALAPEQWHLLEPNWPSDRPNNDESMD